jgi:hypothetical protein
MASRLNLTRDQLANFLNDAEQIKQFENLFAVTSATALNNQNVHTVFAGPATGVPTPPSFRLLVKDDIPLLDYVQSVGATAPITSTGGFNPVIGIAGAALTKVDDTNVVLTLGGSPSTALVAATSITVTWSGTLAITRGGTGAANAADARTNLGLGSGLSTTITTAKLTGGGVNGSMTFVNGILTAQVQAT